MNSKILVAYASRSGSTAGVAQAIGEVLASHGESVDVLPVGEVTDLSSYKAVVAGSAIQGQKWLPEGMKFLHQHRGELSQKPFAAFLVCITLSMKNAEQYREGVSGWMSPIRAVVHPLSVGLFAGTLEFNKMPFSMNTLAMRIPVMMGMWKTGDHRDWNAIRAWAEQTYPLLAR